MGRKFTPGSKTSPRTSARTSVTSSSASPSNSSQLRNYLGSTQTSTPSRGCISSFTRSSQHGSAIAMQFATRQVIPSRFFLNSNTTDRLSQHLVCSATTSLPPPLPPFNDTFLMSSARRDSKRSKRGQSTSVDSSNHSTIIRSSGGSTLKGTSKTTQKLVDTRRYVKIPPSFPPKR